MSFDKVPQEITDYILDFVQDSRPTLHSCLRVSRSFAEASRFHLFRNIDIHGRGKSLGVQGRLAKLRRLIQCPQTAKYIRRLSIWSFPSPDKSRNAAAFILIPFDILEVMLTQLPSLQFLELKYVHITSNTDEFAYCPIPPPCSFHPSRTLQTLEMEGVALDNLDTMLTSLLSLAQPSKLNLSAVFPAKHQDVVKYPPPVLTNPAITTSLRLTCVSDECLQALISSAPNLKTLIIEGPHGPEKSLKLVGELLQQLSSLEELELSEYMFRGNGPVFSMLTKYEILTVIQDQCNGATCL